MKKTFTTIALVTVLTFGATFANANTGIIMGDMTSNNTCTSTSEKDGIIMSGLTGIIVAGLTGIIMGDLTASPCSTTSNRDGIIYGG